MDANEVVATGVARIKLASTCLACGGKMRAARTDLTYDLPDIEFTVENVLVSRCENCGEEYVPGEVAVLVGEVVAEQVAAHRTQAAKAAPTIVPTSIEIRSRFDEAKLLIAHG